MPTFQIKLALIGFSIFVSCCINAQNRPLYAYQDLSKFYFAKQRDSLKKNWVCPEIFKDKPTQKEYKEIWDARTNFIVSAIDGNNFINDDEIYSYVNNIINDFTKANPVLLKQKQFLLIDRSASVNAYAIGGNVIAVNLGLINFSQSREEIALVIAHELSHNILNHAENSMKERAAFSTSAEYKKALNDILDSKYERFSRLKKVLEGYTFSRSKHHRYHESDADSLAIILLKNANISFHPEFFLRLDSSDNEYRQPLKNNTKNYFVTYNLPIEDAWFTKRGRGLSAQKYNFKDTTSLEDSLKTHPDCIERYNRTKMLVNINGNLTPIAKSIKEKANKMLLWNMYDDLNLTACLYRIFLEKDNGNIDPWYDFMEHNVFAGLYYSNKQLHRFNAINIKPKEYISKSYYELQNMLEQITSDDLEKYYRSATNQAFWSSMPAESKDLKTLMAVINFDSDDSEKKKSNAAKEFMSSNPTSMYCEFAAHFKK